MCYGRINATTRQALLQAMSQRAQSLLSVCSVHLHPMPVVLMTSADRTW